MKRKQKSKSKVKTRSKKKETSLAAASKNSVQSGESDSDEEEESKEPPIKLPKIIEVGLCEVFELIKETRFSHPSLCLRSLQALLNVLQGQQPEGLQSEPPEVLGFGVENMATAMDEDLEEELDEKDEKSMMCPPGMHKWKLEQCMLSQYLGLTLKNTFSYDKKKNDNMEVENEEKKMPAKSQHILQALCDLTVSSGQYKSAVDFTIQLEKTENALRILYSLGIVEIKEKPRHGGGWGYSAHSVEAIRFSADTDILLGGLGLFGGRGEYTAKIKLFELGPDGGDHETDGDLLAETDVLAYDCAAREKYAMMFDEPVLLQAGWWYVAWARVSGPSSDCGSHGQASITTDDGLPTSDGSASKGKQQTSEPVHILKRSFARTVSVVRKFVAKDSAGLRIRSHPSLQSEQIGIVKVNGTITFID
ncbi:hypothetical protein GH733_006575, partial [Mirounga leonina]